MYTYRLRLAMLGALIVTLSAAGCETTWHDGYAIAYYREGGSTILVSYQTSGAWQGAPGQNIVGSGTLLGVDLGRQPRNIVTIFGYTRGDQKMRIFVTPGLAWGSLPPTDILTGVASAPAITHSGGDEWLIAYKASGGIGGIEVRPYTVESAGGFGNPLDLTTATTRNANVVGRPAIAYFNGRLVLVWGRDEEADNGGMFRFVAADYQPGNTAISVIQAGEVPGGGDPFFDAEHRSSPTLAHDGVGTFYLAVIRRNSAADFVYVYSSPDGQNWTSLSDSYPGNPQFTLGETQLSIAAKPNGEVLLAIVSGPAEYFPPLVLRFQNGAWTEVSGVFGGIPNRYSDFALVRHQYLN